MLQKNLKRRGREKAAVEKQMKDAYTEAYTKARIEAIRDSARSAGRRAGGFGGLSVARRPKPANTKSRRYEMHAPPVKVMVNDDMGMGEILDTGGDPVGEFKVGGGHDVHMIKAPSINRIVNTNLRNPPRVRTKTNPVNDNRSESLVSLGNVRNPVNVDNRAVSTRIPRTEKVSVKFKGRKPKTATQKPVIKTQLVTEKKFWEI